MSGKQEATYHGADIVTRLRLYGPESDYNGIMVEAANEITELRYKLAKATTPGINAPGLTSEEAVALVKKNLHRRRGLDLSDE